MCHNSCSWHTFLPGSAALCPKYPRGTQTSVLGSQQGGTWGSWAWESPLRATQKTPGGSRLSHCARHRPEPGDQCPLSHQWCHACTRSCARVEANGRRDPEGRALCARAMTPALAPPQGTGHLSCVRPTMSCVTSMAPQWDRCYGQSLAISTWLDMALGSGSGAAPATPCPPCLGSAESC